MKYNILILFGLLFFCCSAYGQSNKIYDLKKDFGAKGDGVTDDSKAWNEAIQFLNNKSGITLFIPEGLYRIGYQDKNIMQRFKYPERIQRLKNARNIKIIGETGSNDKIRARFKYLDGLYFGYFEKNGAPASTAAENKRAELDAFLRIEASCENVEVKNVEVDGNIGKMQLGTNKKHNLQHIGIYINGAQNINVSNVHIHHLGLDGIYIRAPYNQKEYNVVLNRVVSEYNGRQGLSFTAGRGLKVTDSKFRYTGKGGLSLSPSANVDIENHAGKGKYLENILFDNCELYDNAGGSGSINLAGNIKSFTMKNSSIKTTGMYAIQSNFSSSRDFVFLNCDIAGIIEMQVNGKPKTGPGTTKFVGCTISDNKNSQEFGLRRALINVFDQVEFENCNFFVWNKRKLVHSYKNGANDTKKETIIFKNSSIRNVDTKKSLDNNKNVLSKTPERIKITK